MMETGDSYILVTKQLGKSTYYRGSDGGFYPLLRKDNNPEGVLKRTTQKNDVIELTLLGEIYTVAHKRDGLVKEVIIRTEYYTRASAKFREFSNILTDCSRRNGEGYATRWEQEKGKFINLKKEAKAQAEAEIGKAEILEETQ